MSIPLWLETAFLQTADFMYARIPQAVPDKERLAACKIISHRGEHDNRAVFENTMPAFERVEAAGVWGIEFDLRWTRDLHPVVFHDEQLSRLAGTNQPISRLTLAQLKKDFGFIPAVEEVVARFGKSLHLMIEIKDDAYPQPDYQKKILKALLAPLEPKRDFHFLALCPTLFRNVDFVPPETCLPIAQTNLSVISEEAICKHYGGITGHYLLMTDRIRRRHRAQHQGVGTGFVNSLNCLFREINRNSEWIFSETAASLQADVKRLLVKGADRSIVGQ